MYNSASNTLHFNFNHIEMSRLYQDLGGCEDLLDGLLCFFKELLPRGIHNPFALTISQYFTG